MSILKLTSDTLVGTPATGNIEYNGQFFGTDSNNSRAQMQRISLDTAKASTSGTSIDFTGVPAWAKKITVMFQGVSTSGASIPLVQLGVSGTPTTTGYLSSSTSSSPSSVSYTTGFGLGSNNAANILHGMLIITNITGNSWVASGTLAASNAAGGWYFSGSVSLAGTANLVRITTVNGTDTFDAGSINILYEG